MANVKRDRERRRAGSTRRDQKHRVGGDWTSLTVPETTKVWQPKEGSYRIYIVPFVAGDDNPFADPGFEYYERTYYRHSGIGPQNSHFICASRTWSKPCPICEHRSMLARDPDADETTEKLIKSLAPRERQLWLIYDVKDPDSGVQLWEYSHHNFGKLLDFCRDDAEEDEDYIRNFDDSMAGATLKLSFSKESADFGTYTKVSKIDFRPRPDGIPADIMSHGICLDTVLKETPYDKLKKIFLQTGESEESGGTPTSGGNADPVPGKSTAEEYGIERLSEVMYRGQRCVVMKISDDGALLTLMDTNNDDEIIKAVSPAEVKVGWDGDEEPDVPFDDTDPTGRESEPVAAPSSGGKSTTSDATAEQSGEQTDDFDGDDWDD